MFKTILLILAMAAPLKLHKAPEPEMRVLESEQRDGYVCQKVEYSTSKTERVSSYLLIPDGVSPRDKRPALVLLHDHGARFDIAKEKLVKPLRSAPENIQRSSQQWIDDNFDGVYFGDRLAQMGYVVIVPEQLYFGDRSTALCQKWSRMQFCGEEGGDIATIKNEIYEGQRIVYDSLSRKGVIWAEQTLGEDAQAARVLKSLPYVDPGRIGCFGWSLGAHRSWLLAAFCKDIKTGVALCWMTLKETCSNPFHASDFSMYIPAFRDKYEFYDIARWLAPKPYLFLAGSQDKLFPTWAVDKCYEQMQQTYKSKRAAGVLKTEYFEGPHHCGLDVQKRIIDYFEEEL